MQIEINEQTVDRQLVDAGMKSDYEEQAVRLLLFHLFCAIRYYRDMTYAEKVKAGFLYRKKFKNDYSLTGFLKERKRKREKKNSPLHPSYKETETEVKEKEEKIFFIAGREDFHQECLRYVGIYDEQRLADFYNYWSEADSDGKMRFQKESYWNTERRLKRWMNNSYSADNTAAAIRLKRTRKKQTQEESAVNQREQAIAAKREEDNARLEQEIEARKAGAVSYEEWLKMKK